MSKRACLGMYSNQGQCGECPLALGCIDMTIESDGYFDSMARWEDECRELEDQMAIDAAWIAAIG